MTLFNLPGYLDWPAQFLLFTTAVTFVVSIITSNVSQVDRLWTFLPTIYSAYYAFLPLLPNSQPYLLVPYAPKSLGWAAVRDFSPRALLMFTLIFIWMCRLSYNTYRRGLFNLQDEDYRWAVLRKQLHPILFQITNLSFISFIQNLLLLLLGLPTYVASALQPHTPLGTSDYALAAVLLTILAFEFTADNQQFAFHAYKHAYLAKENGLKGVKAYDAREQWPGARLAWSPDDAKRGFITRGLWRYSRHPNFACEQSIWWVITLMPLLSPSGPNLAAETSILTSLWYFMPCISLSILFFSSTLFTEAITLTKYTAAYSAYQQRVGMFSPAETLLKGFRIKVFTEENAKKNIERLVWGASHEKHE